MIDKAICLCVDKRIHFTKFLKQQFKTLNIPLQFFVAGNGNILDKYDHIDTNQINPRWEYGDGIARKNNYNIFLCHQKMLRIAKEDRLNNVLFLEDDALILSRFSFIITDILQKLHNVTWDACYLGYHHSKKEQYELEYQNDKKVRILSSNNIGGWHGVLLNHTSYNKLLNLEPISNMDVTCPKICNVYFSIPRLIFYRNVASNALNEHLDTKFKNLLYEV